MSSDCGYLRVWDGWHQAESLSTPRGNRCEQSKAKQSKAKQSKAKQSKAKQSKAKQSKAKQTDREPMAQCGKRTGPKETTGRCTIARSTPN
jgi:hypothetical protein